MTFWDYLDKVVDKDTMEAIFLLFIGGVFTWGFQQVDKAWNNRGKLKVYYANYFDATFKRSACFNESFSEEHTKYISCILPIQIDFVNTSGRIHVFRAVSAIALYKGKQVETFNPIIRGKEKSGGNEEYKYYGVPNTSYSFTIAEKTCMHTDLLFCYEMPAVDTTDHPFDEVRLQWNDHKDRPHSKVILKIDQCWKPGEINLSRDWMRLC